MKKPAQVTQAQKTLAKAKAAYIKARKALEAAQAADRAASCALADAQDALSKMASYHADYCLKNPEEFNPYN